LLALEDTTSLNFTHRTVRDEMGYTSSKKSATGMQAHSVLLFAPNEERVVGLIEQERWVRNKKEAEKQSCETLLSPAAWKLLWSKQEKTRSPKKAPSVYWAYINFGKLAGWYDSKRNGRVGWERLWEGWFLLQTILEGYLLAKSLEL
ncbi:MAG: hypothetical protein ACRCWB_02030, partial [Enterovibrio sp.]